MLLLSPAAVRADDTNSLSDSEIQGRALAEKILAQWPANDYTNTGVLDIRPDNGPREKIPVRFEVLVDPTDWRAVYAAGTPKGPDDASASNQYNAFQLTVIHSQGQPNVYEVSSPNTNLPASNTVSRLMPDQIMVPFAGSDFWLADLGLEFFHWPQQKIVKKEFHRNCPCTVLQSTNPNPSPGGYSKVVCWIDDDSLGIVEAYAYDVDGRRLKNFYPKSLEKVNGQYQVQSMIMDNLKTGSRSKLDFDLDK